MHPFAPRRHSNAQVPARALGGSREPLSLPEDRQTVPAGLASWFVHALRLARGTPEIGVREALAAPELFMVRIPRAWPLRYPFLEQLVEEGCRVVFRIRP